MTSRTDTRVAAPFSWPTVEQLVVTLGGGPTLHYRLGPPREIRDESGRWRRDERGRVALEAFGVLPLPEMYARLGQYLQSLVGREGVEVEQSRLLACFAELVAFVQTFGPLGFDWPRTFEVRNREADDGRDKVAELEYSRIPSIGPQAARAAVVRRKEQFGLPRWQVTFPAVGNAGPPEVTEIRPLRGLPWEAHVDLEDDTPWQDYLGPAPGSSGSAGGPIWWHREELLTALRVVVAIAGDDARGVRGPLGRLPGGSAVYSVREMGARAPVGIHWQDAMVGAAPADGRWAPFRQREYQVKWRQAGRRGLADFLSQQLAWSQLGVGLGVDEQFRVRSMVGSILELIYLQLVEHLERRPDLGVGMCGYCDGPILRVRHRQQWHSGCSPAGRKRRSRATQAAREEAARNEHAAFVGRRDDPAAG